MAEHPEPSFKWTVRSITIGGFVAGVALVAAAARSGDAPAWWWGMGVPLVAVCGPLLATWLWFRWRYPTKAAREEYIAQLSAHRAEYGRPLDRSRLAHRATRHKKAVLRSGTDATAVITFLADGHRANEFQQLVYLELEVRTVGRGEPYQVRTGEWVTAASAGSLTPGRELRVKVDPADAQRVAVDWERTLRLE